MPFTYDAEGIDPDQYSVAPEGLYALVIVDEKDGLSKNGDRQVTCKVMIESGPQKGKKFTHYVTFLPKEKKAAGMAVHFLKTIAQPWEGQIVVTPEDWIGSRFNGFVKVETWNNRERNALGDISPVTDGRTIDPQIQSEWVKKQSDPTDTAPF